MRRPGIAQALLGALLTAACAGAATRPSARQPPPLDEWESAPSVRCHPRVALALLAAPPTRVGAARALERDGIHRVMTNQVMEIRDCYERALARDPAVRGRIIVAFDIARSGEVTSACVATSASQRRWLEACMVRAVESWRFPAHDRNEPIHVAYPFVLSPSPAEPR